MPIQTPYDCSTTKEDTVDNIVMEPYEDTVVKNYTVEEKAEFPYKRTVNVCKNKATGEVLNSTFVKDTLPENWPEGLKADSKDIKWTEMTGWTGTEWSGNE